MICTDNVGSSKHLPQRQKREPCKGEFAWCWLLGIALCVFNPLAFDKAVSDSNYKPTHYKQYIMMTLNDIDQTYCLIDLYSKENSQWNPKAQNGSHWGIPQGRSTYLSKVDGIKQINWGLRYIGNRYGWVDEANPRQQGLKRHRGSNPSIPH